MSSHIFIDVAVNIACVIAGFLAGGHAHWGRYQPSSRFFVALATFTTFLLWFITGTALHVDFWLFGSDLPFEKTTRFGYLAVVSSACGIYLLVTKQAAAPLDPSDGVDPKSNEPQNSAKPNDDRTSG